MCDKLSCFFLQIFDSSGDEELAMYLLIMKQMYNTIAIVVVIVGMCYYQTYMNKAEYMKTSETCEHIS